MNDISHPYDPQMPCLEQANLANNSIYSLPIDLEAAWGRPNFVTGKLDPETVGSPRITEVVVRGNPIAEAPAKVDSADGVSSEGQGKDALSMDETQ